jgi:hypothetical protein
MLGKTLIDMPIDCDYAEASERVDRWSLENKFANVSRDPSLRRYKNSTGILSNSNIIIEVVIGDGVVHTRGYIQTLLTFITWKFVFPERQSWLDQLDRRRRGGAMMLKLKAALAEG